MTRLSCVAKTSLFVAGALLAVAPGLEALDPALAITQYIHDSWSAEDGAPGGTITGFAQTPNGYLWLGTFGEGLVRFDGVAFVPEGGLDTLFGRRVDRVVSILCGRDGTLWVGTRFGLARFKDGLWSALDRGELNQVYGLHEAPDGTVWYARPWEGVYRVSGDRVTAVPLTGKPRFLTTDKNGTLWAGGYEGLWRLRGSDQRFYSTRDGLSSLNVTSLHADPVGNVWIGTDGGLTLMRDHEVTRRFGFTDGLSSPNLTATYQDRDGVLWVATANAGLNRRRGERFEFLTKALGLTSNRVTALFEDREGSLWVGTAAGLNRLRNPSIVPIGAPEGLSPHQPESIAEGRDGSVYVSAGAGGLNWLKDGRIRMLGGESSASYAEALFVDAEGAVWSGRVGLTRFLDGRKTRYETGEQPIQCVSHDGRSIVFATTRGEVFRLVGAKVERYRFADGSVLGPGPFGIDFVWMMHLARDGTFWLATSRGAIAVRDGAARQVWHQGTLAARSIFEDDEGVLWFGAEVGVVRIAGASIVTFTSKEGLPQDLIFQVVADGSGGIWMSSPRGILSARRADLEAVAAGRAKTFAVQTYGTIDGMRTAEGASAHPPVGCRTRDGRLWFVTGDGIVAIDPAHIPKNTLPPPVVVESVEADGRSLVSTPDVQVPAGAEQLTIHYNGLSLLVPNRVRFKYQLEGFDRDWVDAGGRRAAFYTKLPPGRYTFRVKAANNDGIWNETGASLAIRQRPRFYQTAWFAILLAIVAIGTAFGAYRFRIRRHLQLERELESRVQQGIAKIKTLSGLLPICAWCKKVREDTGYWSQLESYVSEHSHAEFTHGICPDCLAEQRAVAPPAP